MSAWLSRATKRRIVRCGNMVAAIITCAQFVRPVRDVCRIRHTNATVSARHTAHINKAAKRVVVRALSHLPLPSAPPSLSESPPNPLSESPSLSRLACPRARARILDWQRVEV